jgi:uncharacterized protein
MIYRSITSELMTLLTEYPVITILGPRQAGKTTLARETLPHYDYSNLEIPEIRSFATEDPKAYLARFTGPAIIDEIQRVPELLSYIQSIIDEENKPGRFVLTGSHQLRLHEAVSQSLAGRTAVLNLMPLSIVELHGAGFRFDRFEEYCIRGFLPRIYDQSIRSTPVYSNYFQTYVERDVRQLIRLKDITLFEKLMKLLAGRVGQVMDYASLANDVGVDSKTVRNWLSIMEASFILFKLPPFFENFGKRIIKAPKYYFTDVGLLTFLLGLSKSDQVTRDPLVGAIFENLVVLECLKARYNRGQMAELYFFRDSNRNEVDLVVRDGRDLKAIEIKASQTFRKELLNGLRRFAALSPHVRDTILVYNGESYVLSDGIRAMSFHDLHSIFT